MIIIMALSKRKVLVFGLCLVSFIFLFHPGRFSTVYYNTIPTSQMESEFVLFRSNDTTPHKCPVIPKHIHDKVWNPKQLLQEVQKTNLDFWAKKLMIRPGGVWEPSDCISQHKVSILIPFRDRESQLVLLIPYLHHFLQQQMLSYRIVVVEQEHGTPWNKGSLFNAGFLESQKLSVYPCYFFHDVDLIPERLKNIYSCTRQPRHVSANLDMFRYNLIYDGLFGGVVSLTAEQFVDVNGYSNSYSGWGAEDDDFRKRIDNKKYSVVRFERSVARFTALGHSKEIPNAERYNNLYKGSDRYDNDGLRNLNYTLLNKQLRTLYTWFHVKMR